MKGADEGETPVEEEKKEEMAAAMEEAM